MHANCARVHPSFSLSRLTEQPSWLLRLLPLVPFSPALVGTSLPSLSLPLCSAPSLKVTDCLLYYPLVSIFTLLSEARTVSIVPGGEFVRSQYGLEGLRCTDHCSDVIVHVPVQQSLCGVGVSRFRTIPARFNASNQPRMDRRITRLGFVLR